jgi:hypothetical protein
LTATFAPGGYRVFATNFTGSVAPPFITGPPLVEVSGYTDAGDGEQLSLQFPLGGVGTFTCLSMPTAVIGYSPDAGPGVYASSASVGGSCSFNIISVAQSDGGGVFEGTFNGNLVYVDAVGQTGSSLGLAGSFEFPL